MTKCNLDCLNCKYEDCIEDSIKITSEKEAEEARVYKKFLKNLKQKEYRIVYSKTSHYKKKNALRTAAYRNNPENKEKIRAYQKKYRLKNAKKLKKYLKEYNQRPEIKKREKERFAARNARPEIKERLKEYRQRPDVKERCRLSLAKYQSKPEVKARMRENQKAYRLRKKLEKMEEKINGTN